jgi:hypothetical protein
LNILIVQSLVLQGQTLIMAPVKKMSSLLRHMFLSKFLLLWVPFAGSVVNSSTFAKPSQGSKQLEMPDELHSVPSPYLRIDGFSVLQDQGDVWTIFMLKKDQLEFATLPFKPSATKRTERFGTYSDVKRIAIPVTTPPGTWLGILNRRKLEKISFLNFWDSSSMQLLELRATDFKLNRTSVPPNDRIKPAQDRMGEPTKQETARLREQFKMALRKVFGPKYGQVSPLPKDWMPGDQKDHFLVSTNVKGFPLITLSCDKDDSLTCLIDRACFIESKDTVSSPPESWVGVAAMTYKNLKYVILGDRQRNSLRIHRWDSCLNIPFVREVKLPSLKSKITNIYADESHRLWVSTEQLNSFVDSNLFFWDADSVLDP